MSTKARKVIIFNEGSDEEGRPTLKISNTGKLLTDSPSKDSPVKIKKDLFPDEVEELDPIDDIDSWLIYIHQY